MDKRAGDFDIYIYEIDNNIESPLITGEGDQSFPSIDDDLAAWVDNSTGESDIGYLNFSTKQQESLKKPGAQTSPSVYKNYISYLNNGTEIWLFDTKSEKDFQLVPGSIKMEPSIGDRGVIWTDYRAGSNDSDIYMFDFKILADIPIISGFFNQTNPSISRDNIVWTDDRSGYFNVYIFNLTANREMNITNDNVNHSSPDISEDKVIWVDKSKGNLNVFLHDIKSNQTKQITTDNSDHRYPMIDGNRVIWVDNRTGSDQVYLYDISTSKFENNTTTAITKVTA
jgi:beta propeller repeat protein